MKIRPAVTADAPEMSVLLQRLKALGKRTSPADPEFVCAHYIAHPDNIQCHLAEDEDGTLLGFQILKTAAQGNIYGVTPGWGIIGTHVSPDAARRGVGKNLFKASHQAAVNAGLYKIDASIGATNAEGLAYYEAIGFRTYKTSDDKICKYYQVLA